MIKMMEQPVGPEPKLANRFVVEFPKEFGIESYCVQTIDGPKLSATKHEYSGGNSPKFICTGYHWENITITFIDFLGPSTSSKLLNMIEHCKKIKEKNDVTEIIFSIFLKHLDPVGVEVSKWKIDVEELLHVDFGESNYGKDELKILTVLIKPASCTLVE